MKTYHFYFSSQESRSNVWYTAEFWIKSQDCEDAFEDALELLHADGAEYAYEDWYLEAQSESEEGEGYGYYEVVKHDLSVHSKSKIHEYLL